MKLIPGRTKHFPLPKNETCERKKPTVNFTILFPTRERVSLLSNLLKSIDETTIDKTNIEVLAGYDFDDSATVGTVPELQKRYPWFKALGRSRGDNIARDYHNWLYNQSNGRFLIVLNDDTLFKTYGWDQIALKKLRNYFISRPDGIVYGWISDGLPGRSENINYCCFPLISRVAADTVGYVMHNSYSGWGADIHIYKLYDSVNSICNLSEIVIDHISYHVEGSYPRDNVSLHMEKISNGGQQPDLSADTMKLLTYMHHYRILARK